MKGRLKSHEIDRRLGKEEWLGVDEEHILRMRGFRMSSHGRVPSLWPISQLEAHDALHLMSEITNCYFLTPIALALVIELK